MHEAGLRQTLGRRWAFRIEIERIDMLFKRVVFAGRKVEQAPILFVHAHQLGDNEITLGQSLIAAPSFITEVSIQMSEAIAFGPPDQIPVIENAVIVGQVDPVSFA